MGSRDYRKRETKKQKKEGGKKVSIDDVVVSTTEADVIRKPRKERKEVEES